MSTIATNTKYSFHVQMYRGKYYVWYIDVSNTYKWFETSLLSDALRLAKDLDYLAHSYVDQFHRLYKLMNE